MSPLASLTKAPADVPQVPVSMYFRQLFFIFSAGFLFSCCKEIYYRASRIDPSIGTATVYRMINKLEEIGAINRRNMYKVACDPDCDLQNACTVELDDDTIKHLSAKNWNAVIQAGLKACGYVEDQKVRNITVQS